MMQNIRNKSLAAFKNKKGFTLVEVIVVLVILAILAAILVPKLTGWIDQSKTKTATGEGHLVLSALQADASEEYSKSTVQQAYTFAEDGKRVQKYLEGDITLTDTNLTAVAYDTKGGITGFEYTASNGKVMEYKVTAGKGSFTEKASTT